MSELEKAKQELEQVCFAYHKAGGTGDIKDWKYFYDLENKLIEKVKIANQPQLTIPQSIADELDGLNPVKGENKIELLFEGYNNSFLSPELMWVCLKNNNLNLCALYLAGKDLGADLVKVVEG